MSHRQRVGSVVKGLVLIDVQAKDNRGIQNVQILVDGSPAFCSLEKYAPYTCNWDTLKVKDSTQSTTGNSTVLRSRILTGTMSILLVLSTPCGHITLDELMTVSSGTECHWLGHAGQANVRGKSCGTDIICPVLTILALLLPGDQG